MSSNSLKDEVRRDLIEPNREKRALHLLEKCAAQAVDRTFVAENANVYARMICRHKKGETLDVVPMGVSDQDCEIESLLAYLLHQRLPELPIPDPASRTMI